MLGRPLQEGLKASANMKQAAAHPTHPSPNHAGLPTPTLRSPQGHALHEGLKASADIKQVAAHGEILLMVIPTPFVERTVGAGGAIQLFFVS